MKQLSERRLVSCACGAISLFLAEDNCGERPGPPSFVCIVLAVRVSNLLPTTCPCVYASICLYFICLYSSVSVCLCQPRWLLVCLPVSRITSSRLFLLFSKFQVSQP